MTSDSPLHDLPPNDALAALMASPEFQAQMAALTRQSMASLEGLIAALRDAEAQLALVPPPAISPDPAPTEVTADILYRLAVEPEFLPGSGPTNPGMQGIGWGGKGGPHGEAMMGTPAFRAAPALPHEDIAADMLAVLPQPSAGIAIQATAPAAATISTEIEFTFVFDDNQRGGGEGGID